MTDGYRRCRIWAAALIAAAVAVVAGCSQSGSVEDLRILSAFGVDRLGRKYEASGLYLEYDRTATIGVTQGRGDSTELLLSDMNMHSPKPIQTGKLRLLLFSKRMAESGIGHFLHTFCRNPVISSSMIVAVSEETPDRLFAHIKGKSSDILPHRLIKQNVRTGNVPMTNLHLFLYQHYGLGRDPYAPYLQVRDGEIALTGLAVFARDRLKLVLDPQETLLFKWLKGRVRGGTLPFSSDPGVSSTTSVFTVIRGKVRHSRPRSANGSSLTFHIRLHGIVKERPTGTDLRTRREYRISTDELEKRINRDAEALVAKLQANGVDPLGIGDYMRAHTRGEWNETAFYREVYPELRIRVQTRIVLKESGIGN